jgi:hypothetical protein
VEHLLPVSHQALARDTAVRAHHAARQLASLDELGDFLRSATSSGQVAKSRRRKFGAVKYHQERHLGLMDFRHPL